MYINLYITNYKNVYMVIEELISRLPKSPEGIKKAYKNCSRLKRFINVKNSEFSAHLEKAKSDLAKIKSDYDNQAWDWVIIKSYYSIHHTINSLLVKVKGFYSKDHTCTILALKHFELIPDDTYKKLREIDTKFSDFTGFDITYALRKISQYDVRKWKNITKKMLKASIP